MMDFERLTLPPGLSLVATLSPPVLDFTRFFLPSTVLSR